MTTLCSPKVTQHHSQVNAALPAGNAFLPAGKDKTEHAVEVEAESLYEAVALAVADFREDPLLRDGPGQMTEFSVAVLA